MSKTTTIAKRAIDIVLWVILSLLIARFILRLAGASTNAAFMEWLILTTEPLLIPFNNLFEQMDKQRYVLELNTIVAIVFYSVIATLLVKIVDFLGQSDEKTK